MSDGTIENCYSLGDVVGWGNGLGAFIGQIISSGDLTIRNCYALGDVTGDSGGYAGGFIGYAVNFLIENCFCSGNIEIPNRGYAVGGFVGYCSGVSFYRCFSLGNVIGAGNGVGGFIGYASSSVPVATVEQCFAWGNVTSGDGGACGGFIGYSYIEFLDCFCRGDVKCKLSASYISYVGGFVGQHNLMVPRNLITNCYSSGKVETELT